MIRLICGGFNIVPNPGYETFAKKREKKRLRTKQRRVLYRVNGPTSNGFLVQLYTTTEEDAIEKLISHIRDIPIVFHRIHRSKFFRAFQLLMYTLVITNTEVKFNTYSVDHRYNYTLLQTDVIDLTKTSLKVVYIAQSAAIYTNKYLVVSGSPMKLFIDPVLAHQYLKLKSCSNIKYVNVLHMIHTHHIGGPLYQFDITSPSKTSKEDRIYYMNLLNKGLLVQDDPVQVLDYELQLCGIGCRTYNHNMKIINGWLVRRKYIELFDDPDILKAFIHTPAQVYFDYIEYCILKKGGLL